MMVHRLGLSYRHCWHRRTVRHHLDGLDVVDLIVCVGSRVVMAIAGVSLVVRALKKVRQTLDNTLIRQAEVRTLALLTSPRPRKQSFFFRKNLPSASSASSSSPATCDSASGFLPNSSSFLSCRTLAGSDSSLSCSSTTGSWSISGPSLMRRTWGSARYMNKYMNDSNVRVIVMGGLLKQVQQLLDIMSI